MSHPALLRSFVVPSFKGGRSPAAVRLPGRGAPDAAAKLLRRLSRWLDGGYRPERHYMRGGRTAGAKSLAAG